jgi:hypothetical protein
MGKIITKEIRVVLTEEQISSMDDIIIKLRVHGENDPDNDSGLTYTLIIQKGDGHFTKKKFNGKSRGKRRFKV